MAGYSQGSSYTNPNNQSSYGNSSSQSNNSGMPTPVQTPESYYDEQLAEMAAQLASNQYNWAQGQVASNNAVTGEDISAFQNEANNAFGQQNTLENEYRNEFMPENYALVNQAGQYASPSKIAANEGAAESTAEQAGATSLDNLKAQLQTYGVNPSAGEWAGLSGVNNTQTGAAAAGQAEQAQRSTVQTGLGLLENAVSTGEQLPGAAVNAGNLATENVGGAQNAAIGASNANTTAMESAAPYMGDAMQLKLPPVGNISSGSSHSSSVQGSQNTGGGGASQNTSTNTGGSGGGGNYGGGGGGYSGWGSQDMGGSIINAGGGGYSAGTFGDSSFSGFAEGGDVGDDPDPQQQQGVIPDQTSGGHVPLQASPSMGQQTDDVPARLNAEEFVVPRDVARWKGEEFFQNLINDSRKKRMAATAQPSPGPPVGHLPPRFVSHNLGGAI